MNHSRFCLQYTPILCLVALFLSGLSVAHASTNVAYNKAKIDGVWANIVTINLNDPNIVVTPAVAKGGVGTYESFRSMIRRTSPTAAITGTFYCTKSFLPTGDIVIDGQLVWKGYLGAAIAISDNNKVKFLPTRLTDVYRWSDYQGVLAAGPTLLLRGKKVVLPKAEGFSASMHRVRRIRTAVGLTSNNKLLFVTTRQRVTLSETAQVMKKLYSVDAVVMDGGSSTALYCNGRVVNNPSRVMTNLLLVYDNKSTFEQYRSALVPDGRYAKASPDGSS